MSDVNDRIKNALDKYNRGLKEKLDEKFAEKADSDTAVTFILSDTAPENTSAFWLDTSAYEG